MFDVGAPELLVIVIVAIIVIGPKDMPVALRTAGRWIGKLRRMSNHFRSGIDAMIREAELEEMEKKWQEQNRKVMEQYPDQQITAANASGEDFVPGQPTTTTTAPAQLPAAPPASPATDMDGPPAGPAAASAEARLKPPEQSAEQKTEPAQPAKSKDEG